MSTQTVAELVESFSVHHENPHPPEPNVDPLQVTVRPGADLVASSSVHHENPHPPVPEPSSKLRLVPEPSSMFKTSPTYALQIPQFIRSLFTLAHLSIIFLPLNLHLTFKTTPCQAVPLLHLYISASINLE